MNDNKQVMLGDLSAALSVIPEHVELLNCEGQMFYQAPVKTAGELKRTIDLWNTFSLAAEGVTDSAHILRLYNIKGALAKIALIECEPKDYSHSGIDVYLPSKDIVLYACSSSNTDHLFPDPVAIVIKGDYPGVIAERLILKIKGDDFKDLNDKQSIDEAITLIVQALPEQADRVRLVDKMRGAVFQSRQLAPQ